SPKAIESFFQKTILKAIDIGKNNANISVENRINKSIDDLRNSLKSKPIPYEVYYPIGGLADEGLPTQVGNVRFCKFDEIELSRFTSCLSKYDGSEDEKNKRVEMAKSIEKAEINNKLVGVVETKAIDTLAAKSKAIKEIILTLDVINFFSDLIPYQSGHLFLPGDDERTRINVPIISKEEKQSISFGWELVGPIMPLSLEKLNEFDRKNKLTFTKVSGLLSTQENDIEKKIISALQWAGKATIEKRKEEAFLLYAISLESLILIENEKADELGFRLRTRVAHLLGNNLENKKEISKAINDLYGIRSKIVHNGYYQVTDADLNEIRVYSKSCILRLLNDEPFTLMKSKDDLVGWFTERVLL
ncbi:MAG: hypothetical protein ACYDH2_13985, partial [Anaerolineaceae bacterium]